MKKLILMILIAAVGFVQAEAQSDQNGKRKGKMDKAEMKQKRNERLNLNDDQATQLDEINQRYAEKKKAIRQEEKSKNAQVYKDLKENREAEVKAVLDEKQYTEWKASQEKMHKKAKNRKGKMKAAPHRQERSLDKG